MYNNHDEMYEVDDFDEDIKQREALLEEAKKIDADTDLNDAIRQVSDLKKKWKRIHYWESDFEDRLNDEFEKTIDVFYAKRKAMYGTTQAIKQELIDRTKVLIASQDFNKATEEMNELMNQWKAAGSAGKDIDDALWESFKEARQTFFDRKHEHWENLQAKFGNAKVLKQDLIAQAAALEDSEEWQKTSEKFRKLMDDWKSAGSAGREHEDRLWNEFNESRQKFYDRRSRYYDELRGQQEEKYQAKKALVEQAEAIAQSKEYTKEHTQEMKNLGVEWKKIGSCGKDREDQIWKAFRSVMDGYFEGLKQWNEQRHAQWRQRMQENRSRKLELIQNQKRQVKYMQDEIVGLLGQRAIDEMEESIKEKEEFIQELEADLADIDKALGN